MKCMLLAKSAILLDLHAVRHGLLILGSVVVALFALGASKCDLSTHKFLHFVASATLVSCPIIERKK